MKRKLDMLFNPLNVYTKFQIDISKHVEKSPENSDGWTDGRTDEWTDIATKHYDRFSNARMKNDKANWNGTRDKISGVNSFRHCAYIWLIKIIQNHQSHPQLTN